MVVRGRLNGATMFGCRAGSSWQFERRAPEGEAERGHHLGALNPGAARREGGRKALPVHGVDVHGAWTPRTSRRAARRRGSSASPVQALPGTQGAIGALADKGGTSAPIGLAQEALDRHVDVARVA
jgi:hypothetical protein